MLVENQFVQINWRPQNRDYYSGKGYIFTKYGDSFAVRAEELMPTVKVKVDVQCDYCGEIYTIDYGNYIVGINKEVGKCACKKCKGRKLKEAKAITSRENIYMEFIEICNKKGYTPITEASENLNINYKLEYMCPKHGVQKHDLYYLRDVGCHDCKVDERRKSTATEAIQVFYRLCKDNGYEPISTVDDFETEESWLYYNCPKHGSQRIRLRDFKKGHICWTCSYEMRGNDKKVPIDKVVDFIESKNNNRLLNPEAYTRAIDNNLLIQCGSCGDTFSCSLNNYQRSLTGKCPKCNGNSIGELMIHEYLDEIGIQHYWHYSFKDCRDINALPFDFYLPTYNCIIEFDGNHHFEPIFGDDCFIKTQKHDKIKNQYCADNGIQLIRIPYWEFSNVKPIIRNALKLDKFPKIIKYHKNPYKKNK